MLLRIVGIIFPIFIVVLIGFISGRLRPTDMAVANRLNMSIFLPALIFSALASKSFNLIDNVPYVIGGTVVVIGSGLLTWPVARLLGYQPLTLVFPSMINNIGNMGLPLLILTFGESALGPAVVLLVIVTLLMFSLGSWLLSGRFDVSTLYREPLLPAAIGGVLISLSGITLWPPLVEAIKMLGDVSIGLLTRQHKD